jgi:hypothetical protein
METKSFLPRIPTRRPSRVDTSLPALREALKIAAECVAVDPAALPVYERIEAEIAAREGRTTSLDRARALLQQEGTVAS